MFLSALVQNLYWLFARGLGRYAYLSTQTLYDKFVLNGVDIEIGERAITVQVKKKRELPLILVAM